MYASNGFNFMASNYRNRSSRAQTTRAQLTMTRANDDVDGGSGAIMTKQELNHNQVD